MACRCVNAIVNPPPPPCPTTDCCLKACNAILPCDQSVGPCGQTGSYDLTTLSHITDGCSVDDVATTPQYELISFDETHFVSVTVSSAGILTWVTQGPETKNKFGNVSYKISCDADCIDCLWLGSIGMFTIGTKDLCADTVCDNDYTCDDCTGTCVDPAADTAVSSNISNSNTSING